MNTLLLTSQLVAYGVGIVSASLNIAAFMRRHAARRRLRPARALPAQTIGVQSMTTETMR